MIFIIDAYNVLKSVRHGNVITEQERRAFIANIVAYVKRKKDTMVIIFDGGGYPFPYVTTLAQGIVVYSGFQMSADDYIRRYIEENKNKALFLVSSDRELIRKAKQYRIETMGGYPFLRHIQDVFEEDMRGDQCETVLVKTTERDDPELDALMNNAASGLLSKDTVPCKIKKSCKEQKNHSKNRQFRKRAKIL